jgi:hypothetical protein
MSYDKAALKENVTCVIKNEKGAITNIVKGSNIITNDGDIFYAQKIVGETNTEFEAPSLVLGTGTSQPAKTDTGVETPISNSDKLRDSGFPQRDNSDPGNTDGGENVVTWKFSYPLGAVVATGISEGAIVNDGANPTKALNHFLFSNAFDLTSTDQLTVYVNHKQVGI